MSKRPNILFFGIDSLRSDHMSLYGYKRLTTPHIDRFIEDGGIVFDKMYSPSIPTTPGYASMLSGKDCFGTNVVALRHQGGYLPDMKSLPAVLEENGYTVLEFSSDGELYTATGVWDGTTLYIFVNGKLESTGGCPMLRHMTTTEKVLGIGANYTNAGANGAFGGHVLSARVWDAPITDVATVAATELSIYPNETRFIK